MRATKKGLRDGGGALMNSPRVAVVKNHYTVKEGDEIMVAWLMAIGNRYALCSKGP